MEASQLHGYASTMSVPLSGDQTLEGHCLCHLVSLVCHPPIRRQRIVLAIRRHGFSLGVGSQTGLLFVALAGLELAFDLCAIKAIAPLLTAYPAVSTSSGVI